MQRHVFVISYFIIVLSGSISGENDEKCMNLRMDDIDYVAKFFTEAKVEDYQGKWYRVSPDKKRKYCISDIKVVSATKDDIKDIRSKCKKEAPGLDWKNATSKITITKYKKDTLILTLDGQVGVLNDDCSDIYRMVCYKFFHIVLWVVLGIRGDFFKTRPVAILSTNGTVPDCFLFAKSRYYICK